MDVRGPQDWRGGGAAQGLPDVHTFDLIDELVKKLGRREMFPRLGAIVVTGHSAGGQFTHRYAAASRAETTGPVPIRYVVSNPSTYLYLDRTRPSPAGSCSEKGCTGEFVEYADGRNCTTYDRWRNGLKEVSGYAAAVPTEDMKKQLVSRDVTYVLSELDTLPLFGFDSSGPAMAQGPNRLARGLAYWHYLRSKFGAQHKLVLVPACGHNGRCVYTDNRTLRVLFP